ncbi:hypothetical protein ACFL5N_01690, partial [bacterium]
QTDYEKIRKNLTWIRQKPMGLTKKIEKIDIDQREKIKTVKIDYEIRRLYADGMLVVEQVHKERKIKEIKIEKAPVIDIGQKGWYKIYINILEGLNSIKEVAKRRLIANRVLELILYLEPLKEEKKYTYKVKEDMVRAIASAA